ncbi:hypothetical protein PFISCL1PPCAC_26506, partial [Pristionchus fissidentatus]
NYRMRSLVVLALFGLATIASSHDADVLPSELADPTETAPATGPWTWEEIDGKKFKVYKHEYKIPHGFSKKVFIKKTRDHIIKYIRLKKCGCRITTTRKSWEGEHKKLWNDDRLHHHHGHHGHGHGHHHGHHGHHGHGPRPCNGHHHHGHHGHHGHGPHGHFPHGPHHDGHHF